MSTMEHLLSLPIREALPQIREHLRKAIDEGLSIEADLALLANKEPIALGELVVGPKATPHTALVLAALSQIEVLERSIMPKALYQRLLSLGPDAGLEILEMAVRRHAEATWVVPLSVQVEGEDAGLRQLRAVADKPSFIGLCEAYVQAEKYPALIRLAGKLQRLEPVLALARTSENGPSAQAAAALICADPEQHVVAWLGAIRGPDLDDLILAMIPHLTTPAGVRALLVHARGCPRALRRLTVVCDSLTI